MFQKRPPVPLRAEGEQSLMHRARLMSSFGCSLQLHMPSAHNHSNLVLQFQKAFMRVFKILDSLYGPTRNGRKGSDLGCGLLQLFFVLPSYEESDLKGAFEYLNGLIYRFGSCSFMLKPFVVLIIDVFSWRLDFYLSNCCSVVSLIYVECFYVQVLERKVTVDHLLSHRAPDSCAVEGLAHKVWVLFS